MKTAKEILARMVEHTNLNLDATDKDIEKLCDEAKLANFGFVCVRPEKVEFAYHELCNFDTKVVSVVGFPENKCTTLDEFILEMNQHKTHEKVRQAKWALLYGAKEIDMVIDISALKNREFEFFKKDISSVVKASKGYAVKVIIETGFLEDNEKVKAGVLAQEAGACFVKTSTGYGVSGATEQDIELLSMILNEKTGIKASGGIKSISYAFDLYNASQKYKQHEFRIGSSSLAEEF
ncbi:MAG: deoxyribose-phosphate aldolase [Candidatus Nanoarchaeia archaeon]|nr:deoxyribose-phosphate aldolase [Candidatus Nanoarchaeia archaeon]